VLMDCSQCPLHPTLAPVFVKYAKLHTDTVRSHAQCPCCSCPEPMPTGLK
jgi:hypothetical protein